MGKSRRRRRSRGPTGSRSGWPTRLARSLDLQQSDLRRSSSARPSEVPPDVAEVRGSRTRRVACWSATSSSTADPVADGRSARVGVRVGPRSVSPFAALAAQLPQPMPAFDAADRRRRFRRACDESPFSCRSADGRLGGVRSIYVGPGAGPVVLRTSEFGSAERMAGVSTVQPSRRVLLVVDLVNTHSGASGRFFVRRLALARRNPAI